MRVVVDTNVFVTAALKDKSLPGVAVHVIEQRGGLLLKRGRCLAARGRATGEIIPQIFAAQGISVSPPYRLMAENRP
jgi:hypothetical protein